MSGGDSDAALLSIRGLRVEMQSDAQTATVLNDVSISVSPGEVLGLVGESGAGKSVTGAAVIGLLEPPLCKTAGEIWFEGRRIDTLSPRDMRRLRGAGIGMVFQDPLTALNPVFTIGRQLIETIREHTGMGHGAATERAVELLDEVGIPAARDRLRSYPHEFSGGMRQRVVVALALAGHPRLIVADEPTTALDVSIQAQVIALLVRIARELNAGVILITHDMGVIAEAADRVAVMYAGRVVEIGPVAEVLGSPRHPYSQGLVSSIPNIGTRVDILPQIPGVMPRVGALPEGCAFHPRCQKCLPVCTQTPPDQHILANGVGVACWAVSGPPQ